MENTNNNYPLILCFYLDESIFQQPEIMQEITKAVNKSLDKKNANVIAYFLRCAEGMHERIEVLNPILVGEDKMNEINKLVEDIKKQFDIGQGADKDINNLNNEIEIKKECTCKENEGCTDNCDRKIKECSCTKGEECSNCNNKENNS